MNAEAKKTPDTVDDSSGKDDPVGLDPYQLWVRHVKRNSPPKDGQRPDGNRRPAGKRTTRD